MTPEDFELHRAGLRYKFIYSVIGLVLGLACILTGLLLGLAGVTGHTTFTASLIGLNTNLTDAAPGVVVFVVGIFMVWITRFKVKATQQINYQQPASAPEAPAPKAQPATEKVGGAPEAKQEPAERVIFPSRSEGVPTSSVSTITYTTDNSRKIF